MFLIYCGERKQWFVSYLIFIVCNLLGILGKNIEITLTSSRCEFLQLFFISYGVNHRNYYFLDVKPSSLV
jgi:hypothetical protein